MKHIRKVSFRVFAVATLLGLGACSGMSSQGQSTAIGAGVGAVGGAVLTGGSAAGTVGGAVIGGVSVTRSRSRRSTGVQCSRPDCLGHSLIDGSRTAQVWGQTVEYIGSNRQGAAERSKKSVWQRIEDFYHEPVIACSCAGRGYRICSCWGCRCVSLSRSTRFLWAYRCRRLSAPAITL